MNFSEFGFDGNGSFGLTIASLGFIVASVVGVIYINVFKKKGQIVERKPNLTRKVEDFEEENAESKKDAEDKK